MKVVAVLCVLLLSTCAFADPTKEDGVVVLTDENFETFVNGEELTLVEFYAPWCGHCKRLAPEYSKAAKELSNLNPPVLLAKVDATANERTSTKYQVSGYPTLKVFRKGKAKEYQGPRDADGIAKHMQALVGPAAIEINTVEELEKFVVDGEVTKTTVVGVYKVLDSDYARYMEVAEELRGKFVFLVSRREDVMKKVDARHTVVVLRPAEVQVPTRVVMDAQNAASFVSLMQFIAREGLPLVGEYTQDNANLYHRRGQPIVTLFTAVDFKSNAKKMNYLISRLKKVASVYRNTTFVFADRTKLKNVADGFAFAEKDYSADVAISFVNSSMGTGAKWKYSGEKFSAQLLEGFVHGVHGGMYERFMKSEEPPRYNPLPGEGKVFTVVRKNFDEIVFDPTRDVLIEMYAPWCGHCKKLAPLYEQLAEEYKGVDDIIIAKMDATANDAPDGYTAHGFPTLFWAPKGKENKISPEQYHGDREVKDFKKFIDEHRKNN